MTVLKDLSLPLLLILETALCLSYGHFIPVEIKSCFYALSLSIKDALLMVLPILIFSFLASSLSALQKGALSFIVIAFALVIVSNTMGATLAGLSGVYTLSFLDTVQPFQPINMTLKPLWTIPFPQIISTDGALLLGLLFGCFAGYWGHQKCLAFISISQRLSLLVLKKTFIPLIPLFVLGFILKMDYEGILDIIVQNYLSIFLAITVLAYGYIIVLYGLGCGFHPTLWRQSMQRMVPAVITGFSTLSSAAALPLITNASEKTTGNPVVNGVVPLSINIHMIGDCFSLSILALAILTSFGLPLPSITDYMMYTGFFVLARFSVAAVPGGGVIVILPVLEQYLGFSPEMLSLILALYILFDPIATSANVFGNGAFAILFERLYRLVQHDEAKVTPQTC